MGSFKFHLFPFFPLSKVFFPNHGLTPEGGSEVLATGFFEIPPRPRSGGCFWETSNVEVPPFRVLVGF